MLENQSYPQKKEVLSDVSLPGEFRTALARCLHNDLFFQVPVTLMPGVRKQRLDVSFSVINRKSRSACLKVFLQLLLNWRQEELILSLPVSEHANSSQLRI